MAEEKYIEFDFGAVRINRNDRAKNLRIKVHPEKGVSVTIPRLCSEKHAIDFINRKEDWIRKTLRKTEGIKQKETLFSEQTLFRTKFHQLKIEKHSKSSLKSDVKKSVIHIHYPDFASVEDDRVQGFVRSTVIKTLRLEASEYLPRRTRELAIKNGIHINEITVRNNRTRWGSCSGKNNISLNIHLMRLPDELIDYVILHELAHVKHKNHSASFWLYLESICTESKKLDKKLNAFHLSYW